MRCRLMFCVAVLLAWDTRYASDEMQRDPGAIVIDHLKQDITFVKSLLDVKDEQLALLLHEVRVNSWLTSLLCVHAPRTVALARVLSLPLFRQLVHLESMALLTSHTTPSCLLLYPCMRVLYCSGGQRV